MLTELEKRVIASIQGDIAITRHPYRQISERLGIPEKLLLDTLQDLCRRGVIRRFGATLKHQKSGYGANAMVAWSVNESRVAEAGDTLAAFREVSHCYRRNPTEQWPYNLYTMIHGHSEAACKDTARRMSEKIGVDTYILLFSRTELKKTSMRYFSLD
jgi:DNA-binding Lrp family transcriptional regulator